MIKKIKLGSALAALIIFAFPWVDVQCSEKSMAKQSGFQVIYGGSSESEELGAMGEDATRRESAKSEESIRFAPLVALALVAVIGAVVFSGIAVFRGGDRADLLASVLPAVALLLLVIQLLVGFPIKKQMIEAMSKSSSGDPVGESGLDASMAKSMAAGMMMNIRVTTTPAFYVELLALGIPTLIFANGLIDRYKNGHQGGAPAAGA